MTRRLMLLRHGQTEYNATGRMQGHLDTELSQLGVEQAQQVAHYMQHCGITKIVSSDLQRAYKTAEIVAAQLALPIEVDARLRETDLGDWQAKSHEEVDTKFPGARVVWRHDATWAPPGGESRLDVAKRARAVIDELMRDYDAWDDSTVLIVAHGGTISALTSNLLGLNNEQYPMFSGLGNTCWSQLMARPRFDYDPEDAPPPSQLAAHSAKFHAENIGNARWYLDGWNMQVGLGD